MHKVIVKETELNGKKLKLETGKLAQQADAAVVATLGETVILATVATQPLKEDLGYFPLSVEYVEKYYAGGRITGQKFIKRETRPSDKAILSGRAIDRSIRPFFPKDFHNEVQVIITVLSFDGINDPLLAGFIGVSAALAISSVPWDGPLGIIRIGLKGEEVLIDPQLTYLETLDLDLLVAASKDKIAMVEAEGRQVKDELVLENIKKAYTQAQSQITLIEELTKEAGKEKITYATIADQVDQKLLEEVKKELKEKIEGYFFDESHTWHDSTAQVVKDEVTKKYAEKLTPLMVSELFDKVAKEIMNDLVLNKGKRLDGRGMEDVRKISIETSVLPRTHGSALFQRGESQVLGVATLGPLSAAQTLEGMEGESSKRYMHHYNMSINPFASGEVKKIGSPNRRDVGHGDLAERSLLGVLPPEESFPYAMRVVSEVLGANASTSMAAVCASTLSLMNAGVPIEPVAGIALGLLSKDEKFQVITDMQAVEDFYGEMDFKIAGTKNGITGIQMDTKLHGLSFEIIEEAIRQGKKAREVILVKMQEEMPKASELSKYAPKIEITHIKPEEIGMLIGPGGKNINAIIAQTGAQIDIEDDGTVMVSSTDQAAIDNALASINGMFKQVQVGEEYDGKVVRLAAFGAFVNILPGRDGLVHVSQMAPYRVEKPEDIVKEGQDVHVRVTGVDEQGKIGLSMLFGADIKPESEGRPRFGGERSSSFSGRRDLPAGRQGFGGRPSSGGPRRGGYGGGRGGDRRGGGRSGFGR